MTPEDETTESSLVSDIEIYAKSHNLYGSNFLAQEYVNVIKADLLQLACQYIEYGQSDETQDAFVAGVLEKMVCHTSQSQDFHTIVKQTANQIRNGSGGAVRPGYILVSSKFFSKIATVNQGLPVYYGWIVVKSSVIDAYGDDEYLFFIGKSQYPISVYALTAAVLIHR